MVSGAGVASEGISAEEFAELGLALPEAGVNPAIGEEEAIASALARSGPEDVREAVLLREGSHSGLVWAVSFEPSSVVPVLPSGGCSEAPVMKVNFKVTRIDAETGEWLGTRGSQDILSQSDCQITRTPED